MLDLVLPLFRGWYEHLVVMPNLAEPIETAKQLVGYYDGLRPLRESAHPSKLLMTFQLTQSISGNAVARLRREFTRQRGAHIAIAGKTYPLGVTTNSEHGIENYEGAGFLDALEVMEDLDIPALFHGEQPGAEVMSAEVAFLPILDTIIRLFPKLRVVFEHVSTREGIEFVLGHHRAGCRVFGTLTLHHATCTWPDAFFNNGSIRNPHLVCKPRLQTGDNRDAVREAMVSAEACFGFGSDNAPHLRDRKEGPNPPSGIFTPPVVAYPKLAEIFEATGGDWLMRLYYFASLNAARFYGLSVPQSDIELTKEPWTVPEIYNGIVPFLAGETLQWQANRPR